MHATPRVRTWHAILWCGADISLFQHSAHLITRLQKHIESYKPGVNNHRNVVCVVVLVLFMHLTLSDSPGYKKIKRSPSYIILRTFWFALDLSNNSMPLCSILFLSRPRWSRGNVIASRSKIRGFKPGWVWRIFSGRKNPEHKSSGRDFKLGVPSLRFHARKRTSSLKK